MDEETPKVRKKKTKQQRFSWTCPKKVKRISQKKTSLGLPPHLLKYKKLKLKQMALADRIREKYNDVPKSYNVSPRIMFAVENSSCKVSKPIKIDGVAYPNCFLLRERAVQRQEKAKDISESEDEEEQDYKFRMGTFKEKAKTTRNVNKNDDTSLVTEEIEEEVLEKESDKEASAEKKQSKAQHDSKHMIRNASAPVFYPTEIPLQPSYYPNGEIQAKLAERLPDTRVFSSPRKGSMDIIRSKSAKKRKKRLKPHFMKKPSLDIYLKRIKEYNKQKAESPRRPKSSKRNVIVIKREHMATVCKRSYPGYKEFVEKVKKSQADRKLDRIEKPLKDMNLNEYYRHFFTRKYGLTLTKEDEPDRHIKL
ncbi:unnamed protein product [Moneuplotes crassus]|uniref:Uncharacterized protein n=1 Tax=Euplotes crassus TaxID=5936 RepID=A0AAD1UFI8_EUPCR|nr:unnamed protein product [Moneuplotes crassus]